MGRRAGCEIHESGSVRGPLAYEGAYSSGDKGGALADRGSQFAASLPVVVQTLTSTPTPESAAPGATPSALARQKTAQARQERPAAA